MRASATDLIKQTNKSTNLKIGDLKLLRGEKRRKSEGSLQDTWDNFKQAMLQYGHSRKRKKGTESLFK